MCGIVGICSPGEAINRSDLRRMCAEIEHRGPDDEGYYVAPGVGLGMRRLSIIDVSGGHQPIGNEDGSCWIVFNGEIYNHRELQDELHGRGHRFATRSDTEAILHRYEEVGAACAHSLNGMFAYAIWNERTNELLITRDRMGVKPLYYYWDGETLVFASEIKAILASGRVSAEMDPQALWHYLSFRYVPTPLTIWKNIRKLPPGHSLHYRPGGEPRIERYWDIRYEDSAPVSSEAEDQQKFDSLLVDAVRRRLIADVPVGILLSGGLDSSAVAAAVSEVHNAPLKTFSVAFEEGGAFSELIYAREVAQHFGTDHHETVIGLDDFLAFLPELPWYTDEPLADPASVPLHYVSKLAARHVKVVLSGEGSDEVLAGYNLDRAVAGWDRVGRLQRRYPRWMRDMLPRALFGALGRPALAEKFERFNLPLSERNLRDLPYSVDYLSEAQKLELCPRLAGMEDSKAVIARYYARAGTRDPLHQVLFAHCQDWLVEDLLMKADKMTMANSIELRVPFLDYRMVEWLASRPASRKVYRRPDGSYTTKHLLRQFAQSRVPRSVIERPKQGFPVPLGDWMRGRLGSYAREVLLDGGSSARRWFDPRVLQGYVDRGTSMGADEAQRLWLLLVLELWAKRWLNEQSGVAFSAGRLGADRPELRPAAVG